MSFVLKLHWLVGIFNIQLLEDEEFWGGSLGGQLFQVVNPSATDAVLSVSVALRFKFWLVVI